MDNDDNRLKLARKQAVLDFWLDMFGATMD